MGVNVIVQVSIQTTITKLAVIWLVPNVPPYIINRIVLDQEVEENVQEVVEIFVATISPGYGVSSAELYESIPHISWIMIGKLPPWRRMTS